MNFNKKNLCFEASISIEKTPFQSPKIDIFSTIFRPAMGFAMAMDMYKIN